MNILESLETRNMKQNLPEMKAGNTIRVHLKVVEGKKERIQIFEGILIGIGGRGARRTLRVRKISNGVGVERVFPLHSPLIERVEVVQRGQVRRAKLNYMRSRSGKAAKLKEISREEREKIEKRNAASE